MWSTLTIVYTSELATWGSIAAIIAAAATVGYALALAIKGIYRLWLRKNPFAKPIYWLQTFNPDYPKYDAICNETDTVFLAYISNKPYSRGKIKVQQDKYHIYIALIPRLSLTLSEINLRFLGDDESKPRVLMLRDANPKVGINYQRQADTFQGEQGWYSPPRNVYKGKKIFYMATVETKMRWKGKLSLRFYMVGLEARSVRIPFSAVKRH